MAAANDILMPKLGLTMSEGTLAEWLVAPGDSVVAGQPIFVVETDKLASEVEASGPGEIVELVAVAGATLPVGAVVARWTGEGSVAAGQGDAPETSSGPAELAAAAAPVPPRGPGERVVATPLARRIARDSGIDLATVTGTGDGGRIKARDVSSGAAYPPVVPAAAAPLAPGQFSLATEANAAPLLGLIAEFNAGNPAAPWSVELFVRRAVEQARLELAEAVIGMTSAPENVVTYFTPLLEPGQAAALGVGAVREVFRPDNAGNPMLRREIGLVLACDARIFDDAAAARLLADIVAHIEQPLRLLV